MNIPIQGKFCITAADFYVVHGLSRDGADPKMVRWEQISDVEWFSVFKEEKNRSQYRIKLSQVLNE
ncbi:hypothetical protein, partial [Streptococcus pseudopneumoniae]